MKTTCLSLTMFLLLGAAALAEDPLLGEIESVYLTVLADCVSGYATSNRVYAVAMGQTEMFYGEYICETEEG